MTVNAKNLVIATSFSPEVASYISEQWKTEPENSSVRFINTTVMSLEKLLMNQSVNEVDLIISSSPFLFYHLQKRNLLSTLPINLRINSKYVPNELSETTAAVAFSGYGIFYNRKLLKKYNIETPSDWSSLENNNYFNGILMSSPSRSGSNHIMLEMLLQQKGWKQGWQDFLSIVGNISVISSRSFNVVDKVKMGLAIAGISIDSYANNELNDPNVGFVYFPNSIASPTFIAIHQYSKNKKEAEKFIYTLLDNHRNKVFSIQYFAKFPFKVYQPNNFRYSQQKKLLEQQPLDYELLLLRQDLIRRLFDVAITFRLTQLKEVWAMLISKEKALNKRLYKLRNNLTTIPVDENQAIDKEYLLKINNDKNFSLSQEKLWRDFFQTKLNETIYLLNELQ
ncbi:phosphonate ABC transporter substrate-binding protein [Gallibacterium genomosp. 2]|uniref:Phosphonate ABC transporter substrate-binding protein n=2 Tax=Gallibacterium TaxID=155493 RepID=A0A0A2Y5V2_9PAST|nr:phosphonate ABC transporter substrate-binding protein [Gallibacterium genomosp. 2]OBX02193.1 phosphonate ABC transporter substrate-binding protein [Gallibacterium genomosp. 1]